MSIGRLQVNRIIRRWIVIASMGLGGIAISPFAIGQTDQPREFNVPPQALESALRQVASANNLQVLYDPKDVHGLNSPGVKGNMPPKQAVERLIEGTGLSATFGEKGSVVLKPAKVEGRSRQGAGMENPTLLAQAPIQGAGASEENERPRGTPRFEKIEVAGSRLSRAETAGSQDVHIYDRERIDQSGQRTLADFLNTLPEASVNSSERSFIATSVRLRGLPAGTTLILLNGRRVQSSTGNAGPNNFFDLNLIPLAAIDRIEVLPTGSSAIYGGDALAGVINIVMKKEFEGVATSVGYGGASGLDEKSASLALGWKAQRLSVSVIGSYFERTTLFGGEREIFGNQDYRRFGGVDSRTAFSNPGNVFAIGTGNLPGLSSPFAAVPAGSTGVGLTPAGFAATAGTQNLTSTAAYQTIIPPTRRAGIFASATYRFNSNAEIFSELILSDVTIHPSIFPPVLNRMTVPASNAFNPFGVPVQVSYLFTGVGSRIQNWDIQLVRPLVGARGAMADEWSWELTAVVSRDRGTRIVTNQLLNAAALTAALASSNPATAFNPFQDGPGGSPALLASIYSDENTRVRGESRVANGFVKGPLARLPGGPVDVALGGEYEYGGLYYNQAGATTDGSRNAYSGFAEVRVPIIAGPAGVGSETLSLQGATRYDHYSDFGKQETAQGNIEVRPMSSLLLRGTYGTSFKPPSLYNLFSPISTFQTALTDPLRGGQVTSITYTQGANKALEPTTGKTATAGFVFSPRSLPGFEVSVTAWRLEIKNGIALPDRQFIVNNESTFPGRVVRAPSSGGQPGQILSVDATYINFGLTKESGVDFSIRGQFDTPYGRLLPSLAGAYISRFDAAAAPGVALTNRASQADASGVFAPRRKATLGLAWQPTPAFSASLTGRYIGRYRDYDVIHELGNIWYGDALVEYQIGRSLGLKGVARNTKVSLGAVNVFAKLPTYSRTTNGYDLYNYDIIGRFVFVRVGVDL